MTSATLVAVSCAFATQLVLAAQARAVTPLQGWSMFLIAVVSGCLAIGILARRPKTTVLIGVAVVLTLWATQISVFWAEAQIP